MNQLNPVTGLHLVFDPDGSAATVCRSKQDALELLRAAQENTGGRMHLDMVSVVDVIDMLQRRKSVSDIAGRHHAGTANYSASTLVEEVTELRRRLAEAEQVRPLCPECRILVEKDGECSGCGVWFANPCDTCGAPGYHTRDCEELIGSAVEDAGEEVPR